MRKLFTIIAAAAALNLSGLAVTQAAPVAGFEAQYEAAFAACAPGGSPEACEAAINALSAAMIAAGVAPAAALQSFTELRAEVVAAGGDAAIQALFEELLPESGAVGDSPSPTTP